MTTVRGNMKTTVRMVQEALLAVLNSTLVSNNDHDWRTCTQTSCVLARQALPKEWTR